MFKKITQIFFCLLMVFALQLSTVPATVAGEKEERVELLQKKLEKLKQLLVEMQEQKLKEQPPTDIPWEPVLGFGQERPAYDQYAYFLAPQMTKEVLDSTLQQLHFVAGLDTLKDRGTLFVVPALPLATGTAMSVSSYNRELATAYLRKIGIPVAIEGGLIVAPDPLTQMGVTEGPLLMIDLTGCDQMLRARIFEVLQDSRLFTGGGSMQDFLWKLLKNASPQSFTVSAEGERMWLSVAKD